MAASTAALQWPGNAEGGKLKGAETEGGYRSGVAERGPKSTAANACASISRGGAVPELIDLCRHRIPYAASSPHSIAVGRSEKAGVGTRVCRWHGDRTCNLPRLALAVRSPPESPFPGKSFRCEKPRRVRSLGNAIQRFVGAYYGSWRNPFCFYSGQGQRCRVAVSSRRTS